MKKLLFFIILGLVISSCENSSGWGTALDCNDPRYTGEGECRITQLGASW